MIEVNHWAAILLCMVFIIVLLNFVISLYFYKFFADTAKFFMEQRLEELNRRRKKEDKHYESKN